MSSTIRGRFAGGLYFFTLLTSNHRPFLTSPLARKTLRFSWKDVQSRYALARIICWLAAGKIQSAYSPFVHHLKSFASTNDPDFTFSFSLGYVFVTRDNNQSD